MKLIWVLLVTVATVNVSEAQSLTQDTVLEKYLFENDVSKASTPLPYVITRKRGIRLFSNLPCKERNFNLNPTVKTVRQTQLETYRRPFMKKLLIKDISNKEKVKVTTEVTTRRYLMPKKNFSVRPRDVYSKNIHNKYNSSNRNNSSYNFEKLKSNTNFIKGELQPSSEEKRYKEEQQNVYSGDKSINDHDFVDFQKQQKIKTYHTHDDIGLQKSKTLLLFPKRNVSNHLKLNNLKIRPENKIASNVVNDQNSNIKIIKNTENIKKNPETITKLDSKHQFDEVKEPKANIAVQEEFLYVKDGDEFVYVKEVTPKAVLNEKRDVSGNDAVTDKQPLTFYNFLINKLYEEYGLNL